MSCKTRLGFSMANSVGLHVANTVGNFKYCEYAIVTLLMWLPCSVLQTMSRITVNTVNRVWLIDLLLTLLSRFMRLIVQFTLYDNFKNRPFFDGAPYNPVF